MISASIIGFCQGLDTLMPYILTTVLMVITAFFHNLLSNARGVGFYINSDLNFSALPELLTTAADYEALWIEIYNSYSSNILCAL